MLFGVSIWGSIADISAKMNQLFLNSYVLGTLQQIIYFLSSRICLMSFCLQSQPLLPRLRTANVARCGFPKSSCL